MSLSRRRLIHLVGRAGGVAAAYRTMAAMGLLPVPAAYAGPPTLAPGSGQGTRVLILGAGIAGMVSAHELGRAGYECRILEARTRSGGRNWSLRAGDAIEETTIEETTGEKTASLQWVRWDSAEHLYFNPGPARLPHDHQGILGYCRELKVPVEVMCNDDRAALLQDDAAFGGAPQSARAVISDSRGYVAELAAKAVAQDLMSGLVTDDDRARIRDFLRGFGALDADLIYRGSARAGYAEAPGGGLQEGRARTPLDLRQILASDFWQGRMQFGELATQTPTMLQPVGGMGRIGESFARRLGAVITHGAAVTALRRTAAGARVEWRDTATGTANATEADFVICTIPLSVLRGIAADFAPATHAAIASADYVPAAKIAFQAERRFWELDAQIYGGISWTSRDATQIWYPSAGLHQRKGVLVSAYVWSDDIGRAVAARAPEQRLANVLDDGEHLHPGSRAWLRKGVSVAWKNIPYSVGAWAEWSEAGRRDAYPVLLAGDGPVLFAGEHMSHVTGWQEGAVLSAHYAISQLNERVRARRL